MSRTRRLLVFRRFSDGQRAQLGTLAQNARGVYFQYDADYLSAFPDPAPLALAFDSSLQRGPKQPFEGLHGLFSDSLPDGWGRLLLDRRVRQLGLSPLDLTMMDRLACQGDRGAGALEYEPVSKLAPKAGEGMASLADLGENAQGIFDGNTQEVLEALANAGSSGGARPKAAIFVEPNADFDRVSTSPQPQHEAWMIKFTSASLALGHAEGVCEAAYLELAARAGLNVPEWKLIPAPQGSGAKWWLATKRFDRPETGKLHMASVAGLLDADYRAPSMDYEDLIRATGQLCKSVASAKSMFARSIFNLLAANQDDHAKNWAFLQADSGEWELSPQFDLTFSPSPSGEHMTAYAGFGAAPPRASIIQLGRLAGYRAECEIGEQIDRIGTAIRTWPEVAQDLDIDKATMRLVQRRIDVAFEENRDIFSMA